MAAGPWAFAEDDGGFRDTVAPLLEKHCLRCHGPKEQDGELRLDAAASARDVQRKPRLWRLIADRLRSNESKIAETKGITLEQQLAERAASIPAGRIGDPAEFGDACAYLCSSQAGFVTGQNFLIDGGLFTGTF